MPVGWFRRKLSLGRVAQFTKGEKASEERPSRYDAFVVGEQERIIQEMAEETDGSDNFSDPENLKQAAETEATRAKAIDDEQVQILEETAEETEGFDSVGVLKNLNQSIGERVATLEALVTKFDIPDRVEFNTEISLSREQKNECREMLRALQNEASISQWQQIRARLVRVCQGLSGARVPWVQDFAKLSLYLSYRIDLSLTGRPLDAELNRAETETIAALAYLIETDDVIPDHIVGSGYMDDAFIVTEVFKALSKSSDGRKILG